MAEAGATITGLNEMKAAARKLPAAVSGALRKVARDTALRVRAGARARVAVETGITRDSIDVYPRPEERLYRVGVFASPPHVRKGRNDRTAYLPNLAVWLELGTVRTPPRPFLTPALEAESDGYVRNVQDAAERTATDVLNGGG